MKQSVTSLKILFVVPYFAPAWSYGGTVRASFDFARELVRQGNQVTVATTDVLDAQLRNRTLKETIEGVRVVRFKNLSNRIARNYNLYTSIGFSRWLKNNLDNFDIVHIHELFTYQSIITSRLCLSRKKPYLIQPHGSLFSVARRSRFSFIKDIIINRSATLLFQSNSVVVLNEKERKDVTTLLPELKSKIVIVPNGLNLGEFREIKKVDLCKRYHIPKERKIIAFIGRIKFIKGLDIAFKVLAGLKKDLKFTFLIIGPDEGEKDNLRQLAKELGLTDRIVYAGLLSGAEKLEILKSADLSLLLSRSEGLPTTLLESAALGLPIVCSTKANLPEVDEFKAGYIVNNEKETAEKIKTILTDAKLQAKLAKNALKLAGHFDLTKRAERLIEVYQSIL